MRLARVATADDGVRLALSVDGAPFRLLHAELGGDTARLLNRFEALPDWMGEPLGDDAAFLCPVERPGKIIGVGLNYRSHAREQGIEPPDRPALFFRPQSALANPRHALKAPAEPSLDYEGELAVVIGQRFHGGDVEAARAAIAGYCVANDLTLRPYAKPNTLPLAKGLDGSLPLGPWITAAGGVDPSALRIFTTVNGAVRQDCSTADMVVDCFALVQQIGAVLTLHPGDVILTGSPPGTGASFDPPRWLQAGDVVRVTIEGLGDVETRIEKGA